MLLSFVNTKLRDQYDSLDALCEDLQVEADALKQQLSELNYHYDSETNQFR